MKSQLVKEKVLKNNKGSFCKLSWTKQLKTNKQNNESVVEKRCTGVVRFGVQYDNIGVIKNGRDSGILPTKNQGLPWGEWDQYPYFIKHNGKTYLRCYISDLNPVRSKYYIDGIEVNENVAKSICVASEFSNKKNIGNCMTLNIDNIITVG